VKRYSAMSFEDNLGNEFEANMEEQAEGEWVRYSDVARFIPSSDFMGIDLQKQQDHVAMLRDVSWALAMDGASDLGFRVRAAAAEFERLLTASKA
jgi:hypothetical protein